jgi:hypothetical protein
MHPMVSRWPLASWDGFGNATETYRRLNLSYNINISVTLAVYCGRSHLRLYGTSTALVSNFVCVTGDSPFTTPMGSFLLVVSGWRF